MEVGRPRALDKDSLCLVSQETAIDFFAWIIAQDSGKFFYCGTNFISFKPKHVNFGVLDFHSNTKEIPLDFDIPQSLNSLQFAGCKIGLGTKIKAKNPSIDIINC